MSKETYCQVAQLTAGCTTNRWSCRLRPFEFNDPFDTISEIRFAFEAVDLPAAFAAEISSLIAQPWEPVFIKETELSRFILEARRLPDQFAIDPMVVTTTSEIAAAMEAPRQTIEAGNREWLDFLGTWRIYCLSAVCDNLLMWAHYADCHRGAVVGFRCVPDEDSCFCAAVPVIYDGEVPTLGLLTDWIRHVVGTVSIDFTQRYLEMTLTKSTDWSYEREVRYALPKLPESNALFDIRTISPKELHSVYLGCRMTDADRKKIVSVLEKDLSHVELYQAHRSKRKYALEFQRLK
jgi:hypothetical protein